MGEGWDSPLGDPSMLDLDKRRAASLSDGVKMPFMDDAQDVQGTLLEASSR